MSEVQNPELIYLQAPLPDAMRGRLRELGYSPEAARLLVLGAPIIYQEDGALVVEYPSGRRLHVERWDELGPDGAFLRWRYRVVRELTPAAR